MILQFGWAQQVQLISGLWNLLGWLRQLGLVSQRGGSVVPRKGVGMQCGLDAQMRKHRLENLWSFHLYDQHLPSYPTVYSFLNYSLEYYDEAS